MAPGLLGLFSKRDKSKTPRKNKPEDGLQPGIPTPSSAKSSTAPSVDASEQQDGSDLSMETEYVLAEADSPALRNGIYHLGSPGSSSASSTKLKMPFRRRKQSTAPNRFSPSSSKVDLTDTSPPPLPPPKPSYLASRSSSDQSFESLRPPPSRSAIFSSYAEPHSALSTRSLPQDQTHLPLPHDWKQKYETMSNPDPHHPRSPLPTPSPKKPSSSGGGFFSWARPRDRTKSKPSTPAPEPLPSVDSASFNLKSFRHVTSPSPSPIPDRPPSALSSYNVPPARPRPRGESAASDSSQRISVAAFREAQARRSAANSPVPSALGDNLKDSPYLTARRSPSGQPQERGRKRSSTVGAPPPMLDGSPISRLPPPARTQPTRSATAPLFPSSATSTSSEESESEESESEEETLRPSRKRTLTGRKSSKAQSELGHRSQPLSSPFTSPSPSSVPLDRSQGSVPPPSAFETRARPQQLVKNDRTPSVYSRTRASVSTSALVPDAAAKRASLIAKQSNTGARFMLSLGAIVYSPIALRNAEFTRQRVKSSASTSSESSSSGSSEDAPLASFMLPPRSSSATSLTRIPAKPLIDITELTGQSKPAPRRTVDNADFDASARRPGASAPPRAESQDARPRKTSLALGDRLTQLAASATAGSASSQARESDSRSVRAKSPAPGPALNLKVDTRPPPSSYNASSGSETSPPIVPTPIRERPRNPSFTVTSRPTSHASSGSVGTVTALEQAMADEAERNNPTVRMVRSGSPPRDRSLPRPNPNTSNARVPTTTLVSRIPHNDVTGSAPPKPFSGLLRDNSPASSTATGDSSSARMPVTPRDGSELGVPIPIRAYKDSNSSMAGGAKSDVGGPGGKGHRKRASVTFAEEEDPEREAKERRERRRSSVGAEEEVRGRNRAEDKRRERRRSEAKAAIEVRAYLWISVSVSDPVDYFSSTSWATLSMARARSMITTTAMYLPRARA
ncbi:hypothetical protein BV25DRAFT_1412763 [Artomyces pyxidatus]|uniref:Uncharacterized protein n=1 Tax=Artomyces pyxidatus TaxID=48021 RepID=A0ACB8TDZ4_9AGAM|nr:hypothetical protein BV25DRAFT_1412763 [Artomyces pyxidatus]